MVKGPRHMTVGETGKCEELVFSEGHLLVDITLMNMVLLSKGGWGTE